MGGKGNLILVSLKLYMATTGGYFTDRARIMTSNCLVDDSKRHD